MNLSLPNLPIRPAHLPLMPPTAEPAALEEDAHTRHLRSLRSLFALYTVFLALAVMFFDGADVGCILAGIAGHVLWASARTVLAWREASWLERARERVRMRHFARASMALTFASPVSRAGAGSRAALP